jgi:hypothetical protein
MNNGLNERKYGTDKTNTTDGIDITKITDVTVETD